MLPIHLPRYCVKLLLNVPTILLAIFPTFSEAQDMKAYDGHWEAALPNDQVFSLSIGIRQLNDSLAELTLSAPGSSFQKSFPFVNGQAFVVSIDEHLRCSGVLDIRYPYIRVCMQGTQWQYHMILHPSGPHQFMGTWNILLAEHVRSPFYLSIENPDGEHYEAYAFSADHRFPGFACYDFAKQADSLHFSDFRTGLDFEGKLRTKAIDLTIKMAGIKLTTMELHASLSKWKLEDILPEKPHPDQTPIDMHDGLPVGNLADAGFQDAPLRAMVDSIIANQITHTQSVLIARKGRLVYEKYFDGFDAAIPHDMRSASKSISSALIGIAMDQGVLHDTSQKLFDLLPQHYRYAEKSDIRKADISIGNLLTMSSGLDAIDFGIDRKSAASEDMYQPTPDWVKTIVEAPMINQPGSHANYSSANPFLLGVVLDAQLKQPLASFMDDNLFAPLGIDTYLVQNDCFGKPYFGGGMLLRSRDMLKFGLLYAQNGRWKDRQVISLQWVASSFKKYLVLENHPEKNEYGFLWWHYAYQIGDKTIRSIEARGAGGQYIFIIPDDELVVVITSANFRNGRVWQPEKIMENYILKAFQGSK
jgi:CubicO group peptidase (beta-lactamase class C family)